MGGYLHLVPSALLDTADLLASPVVHERSARRREHRPWPAPSRSWVMAQTWLDLLFAHWPVSRQSLERALPAELSLDLFDGQAWLGITPFAVRNLRLRISPPVPFLSAFPEVNVRTYVVHDEKPGVYFFSLDAGSRLAVAAARRFYRLPYFRAESSIERGGEATRFISRRAEDPASAPGAGLSVRYRPVSRAAPAPAGSLEHWLTERYCLYTLDDRHRLQRGDIHHPPWPLQAARAEFAHNTMAAELGLELGDPPLVHFARRQDVVFWSLGAATQ
jgi:uncharacterized protein YqjF (DUF2071 family)